MTMPLSPRPAIYYADIRAAAGRERAIALRALAARFRAWLGSFRRSYDNGRTSVRRPSPDRHGSKRALVSASVRYRASTRAHLVEPRRWNNVQGVSDSQP